MSIITPRDLKDFMRFAQFYAAIEAAILKHLQNAECQHSKEGAPFMGTALAG
jgi:hypothetical protein